MAFAALKLAEEADELRVQLVGLGDRQDFRVPLLEEATVWISATPFVVTRYPKLRGTKRDRPEDYASPRRLRPAYTSGGVAAPAGLAAGRGDRRTKSIMAGTRLRSIQFQRFRNKRGDDGGRRPAAHSASRSPLRCVARSASVIRATLASGFLFRGDDKEVAIALIFCPFPRESRGDEFAHELL